MARTIDQIFASMTAAKDADARLAGLTSTSATAIWRLLFYVVAVATWAHETLWDAFVKEVNAIVAKAPPGTPGWWADQLLAFQEGYSLKVINNVITYDTDDPAARIITRATANVASDGKLVLKVARAGTTPDTLQALSDAQKAEATAYLRRRGFAGIKFELVSLNADRLKLRATVYYDGQLALDGAAGLRVQVAAALRAALATLPFDGALLQSTLEDAIQSVEGVQDVAIVEVVTRSGLVAYDPTRTGRWDTRAGYIVEDDTAGADFASTLTFEPYV
jgi:hypothetical protein